METKVINLNVIAEYKKRTERIDQYERELDAEINVLQNGTIKKERYLAPLSYLKVPPVAHHKSLHQVRILRTVVVQ